MKTIITTLLLLFSFTLFCAEDIKYSGAFNEDLTDLDLDDARYNFKTGLFETDYLSSQSSRISIAYHGLMNLKEFTDIAGFEFIYAKRAKYSWFELLVSTMTAEFEEITDLNSNQVNPPGLENEKESLFSIGPGISYRTNFLQNFFSSRRISESSAAYLLYHSLNEKLTQKTYKGIGLRTDFSVNYALSKMSQFGLKFSYNVAPLKREQDFDGETSSARSLLLSYLSLGFDLSYFF